MNYIEFKKYIESMGFEFDYGIYSYKDYTICVYTDYYNYYNGSGWAYYEFNDLTPLKKFNRSYKLKKILE